MKTYNPKITYRNMGGAGEVSENQRIIKFYELNFA